MAFDSSVLVTWLRQEPRWEAVDRLLAHPDVEPVLLGPVLTEVVHVTRRKGNTTPAQALWVTLQAHGASVVPADDGDLVAAAELLELSDTHPGPVHPRTGRAATLSLAEALVLAMAQRRELRVLTRDRHWSWLQDRGLLQVRLQTF